MNASTVLPLLTAVLLAGCSATMSTDQCRTVDWRTVGYEDGVAGHPGNQIGRHRAACAEHGVTPDLDAYGPGPAACGGAAGRARHCAARPASARTARGR